MALYARTLTLEPDFTGTALDGELHFKGRIALWYPALDGSKTVYQ